MGIPEREGGCKSTLTSISVTALRRGSADSALSWCMGHMPNTSLDKDQSIKPGLESRQSRDLPVDSKKLVIRRPIKKNSSSREKKLFDKYFSYEKFYWIENSDSRS